MALKRLQRDEVYRFYLASPLAFADWTAPTTAELNANPTNLPSGQIFNLTCALNTDGTQFDLDDPEIDDTLTFCQTAGNGEVVSRSATIVFESEMSKERWTPATSVLATDGYNVANLAFSLLAWRGVEYYALLSVGKSEDEVFAVGDRIKMAQVSTDWGVPVMGTGENLRISQTFAKRSNLNWNYELAS